MMSERVFVRTICAPLALVYGVGGVVGSCTYDTGDSTKKECGDVRTSRNVRKFNPNKSSETKGDGSSLSRSGLKRSSAGLVSVSKQDVVGSSTVNTVATGPEKTNGNSDVATEGVNAASKDVALTSEDKDKIIKILLNKQSTEGGQTVETKAKKKSELAAGYFQKFGSVGAFVYAMYGTFDILRGNSNLKDVATTANAVLGLSTFGAAAIEKF